MEESLPDRLSGLPREILHHILSFLDTKNVIRTGILSKTFLSMWKSFPVLDFHSFNVRETSVHDFLNYVTARIQQQRCFGTDLQSFRLHLSDQLPDREQFDRVVCSAVEGRVGDLSLSVFRYDYIRRLHSPHSPLPAIVFAKSIKKLTLKGFKLENFNQKVCFCPLLQELDLYECRFEDDFEFSSCVIKSINLGDCKGFNRLHIESPSLEHFYFNSHWSTTCESINDSILKFVNLKVLYFSSSPLTDLWIEEILPQFVCLHTLEMSSCNQIENFKVSNKNLKQIYLIYCRQLRVIEVGAINLETFKYEGLFEEGRNDSALINISACKRLKKLRLSGEGMPEQLLQEQVSTFNELDELTLYLHSFSGSVEINLENLTYLFIDNPNSVNIRIEAPRLDLLTYCGNLEPCVSIGKTASDLETSLVVEPDCDLDNSYFLRWIEFLRIFGSCEVLTLSYYRNGTLTFPQELRNTLFAPLRNLKHLIIELHKQATICTELVDSLLWLSPRLETLGFSSGETYKTLLSIEFEYEEIVNKDDKTMSSSDVPVELLRFKTIELQDFGGVDEKDNLSKYFEGKAKSVIWE